MLKIVRKIVGSLLQGIGWVLAAIGWTTAPEDALAIPKKLHPMTDWIVREPSLMYYGACGMLIVLGLALLLWSPRQKDGVTAVAAPAPEPSPSPIPAAIVAAAVEPLPILHEAPELVAAKHRVGSIARDRYAPAHRMLTQVVSYAGEQLCLSSGIIRQSRLGITLRDGLFIEPDFQKKAPPLSILTSAEEISRITKQDAEGHFYTHMLIYHRLRELMAELLLKSGPHSEDRFPELQKRFDNWSKLDAALFDAIRETKTDFALRLFNLVFRGISWHTAKFPVVRAEYFVQAPHAQWTYSGPQEPLHVTHKES